MNGMKNTARIVELLALVTAPFVLIAVVFVIVFADHTQQATAGTTASPTAHQVQTVAMTVVTDAQTGRAGYIAMVPSNITLPAHATVRIRITNFDGATPQKPAIYAKVWGTAGGTIQVQSFKTTTPNKLTPARTVRSLAAGTQVSHTFTVMGMHLNVPVLAAGVTTFIVHTGAPGHYHWQCFNPCGDGASGWKGPMADMGYMQGTVTVA